jgi:hypothetical protein
MRFILALPICLLAASIGCSGKSNDEKSVELILENTPNMKLIHLPSATAIQMLSGKGIQMRGDGCPMKFTKVPRGFYESDGRILPACVPSFTSMAMPYEIDYLTSGEKTPIPPDQIVH